MRQLGVETQYKTMSLDLKVMEEIERLAPEIETGYVIPIQLGGFGDNQVDFFVIEDFSYQDYLVTKPTTRARPSMSGPLMTTRKSVNTCKNRSMPSSQTSRIKWPRSDKSSSPTMATTWTICSSWLLVTSAGHVPEVFGWPSPSPTRASISTWSPRPIVL